MCQGWGGAAEREDPGEVWWTGAEEGGGGAMGGEKKQGGEEMNVWDPYDLGAW